MDHVFHNMTRRQLLQTAAASALVMGTPNLNSCSSLPKYQPSGSAKGKALYITHGEVVDVVHREILHDRAIVVRNGYIEAIKDQIPSPREGDMVLDLKNKFVIPGLIDAHCHATMPGESAFNPSGVLTTMHQLKRNYVQQIKHGVTTIRDMGAMPKVL
ncbi:MAG: amidohydrolase family protein, partial [Smithellaceae bacterium]|nr:amidohydrolase family protein [Smithellaceae bacterium]